MSHRCRKTSLRIYFQVVFSVYCWLSFELMIVQLDCSCFGFREISLPLTPRSLWLHISCHQPQRDMWCSRWEVKALPGSHTENFCEVGSVLVLKFDIVTVQSFPKHCKLIRLIGNLALWKKSWTCCTWMSHPMYRWRISYMGAYAILPLMLTSCIWSLGVKTRVRSLFRLKVVSMRGFHFWCIEKKSPLCPGLTKYVELYPDRLVYDTMQNPEKRARMSTKQGYLQTLTTGVSALWSRRFSRFIRHILGIRFWFDENLRNFEQDLLNRPLPRWVRARAPRRLQNRLVYGARARTHFDLIFRDQGVCSKGPVQNFLEKMNLMSSFEFTNCTLEPWTWPRRNGATICSWSSSWTTHSTHHGHQASWHGIIGP